MRFSVALPFTLVLFSTIAAQAETINVPADQPTIQAGIDAAVDGDTVLVAPGTYVENIDFNGKGISIISIDGPSFTVIDGGNPPNPLCASVVVFRSGEKSNSVLDGFVLTNGKGTFYETSPNESWFCGGGIFCESSSPEILNNIITLNWADLGAGIYNRESNPKVTHCSFTGNFGEWGGAGICNDLNSCPQVINCLFFGNFGDFGGAIRNTWSSHPIVTNCTFYDNKGIGGSLYNMFESNPKVFNCILWKNGVSEIYNNWFSEPDITFCDVLGGETGMGNIDADPLFVDPLNNDFHLTWLSPCINRGTNVGAPADDIDGDPRPCMGTVEMGADEYTGIHPLSADAFTVSVTGGTINLTLNTGTSNAWRNYLILGSLHGSAPGLPLPGGLKTFRMNWDAFTDFMIPRINGPIFTHFLWSTDGLGRGAAQINAPPVSINKIGKVMTYAYCLEGTPDWDFVSNPVEIEFVP